MGRSKAPEHSHTLCSYCHIETPISLASESELSHCHKLWHAQPETNLRSSGKIRQGCEIRRNTWTRVSNAHYSVFNTRIQLQNTQTWSSILAYFAWFIVSGVFSTSEYAQICCMWRQKVTLIKSHVWVTHAHACVCVYVCIHMLDVSTYQWCEIRLKSGKIHKITWLSLRILHYILALNTL